MQALRRDTRSDDEWSDKCRAEFVNNSIIADWGNQRQYIVSDVVFDLNPGNLKFEYQGD